ncbi:MAG: SGNH/GDSL hydrolase family protein [Acidimicrobiales bacterium]
MTTTTAPPVAVGPGDHGPITSPPLPAPGPGFNEGQVTAVGDSVMLDYTDVLQQDIPGILVTANVGEQWTQGQSALEALKASGRLGAVVIVGLGTNGTVSATQFNSMMTVLAGASRVVFVNDHVDRTWQDSNNAVLAAGVNRFPNTVLADWNTLADQHPTWFYPTGTHLPPESTGARALAAMVANTA